ncbi:MAG TPA: hypothetical protein VMV38_00400 [Candidatus Paceibacterota bacterium]|nr:hypothetical protein [Candidatus Paceibacterota bacterium]
MALPPTIPTSFVPHVPTAGRVARSSDFTGVLGFIAYGILGIVFILAIGVFFYNQVLIGNKTARDADLAKAEAAIDPATVESFVQLRDRLDASQTLLANHTAFSGFFATLEKVLPQTVLFTSLHIALSPTGAITVNGTGVAKSFNALSATSEAFATDSRIKDVIFSKMSINKDSSVSFNLAATLDPSIIAFSPNGSGTASPSTAPSATASTTVSTTTKP